MWIVYNDMVRVRTIHYEIVSLYIILKGQNKRVEIARRNYCDMELDKIQTATELLKSAWIDDEAKVIVFRETDGARIYSTGEGEFWRYIMDLVMMGYRIG
jgi:homoserine trans-succinylase